MPCEEGRSKPRVVALVMAAGLSRRFGSDKRRARLPNGRTLLQATLALAKANFETTWVVLRQQDDPDKLDIESDVHVLHAPSDDIGLGTSLGAAFSALQTQIDASDADAAAVMLGDMPWVSPHTCRTLIDHAHAERIVLPRQQGPHHKGRPGHPVLFGQAFWPTLGLLSGDAGAREVLRQHASMCTFVDVDDPGIHRDVDTPMELD
nr:nucleotidyltransferase family protein [uncultured Halomonas sp.]